jgi:hypothetical protein
MADPILTLEIRRKSDVLAARQRARQVAGMLGFEAVDQAWIAARVFEVACRVHALREGGIRFQLEGDALQVVPVPVERRRGVGTLPPSTRAWNAAGADRLLRAIAMQPPEPSTARLEARLPHGRARVAREDLAFLAKRLAQLTPLNVFEEVRRLNLEVIDSRHAESPASQPTDWAAPPVEKPAA